MILICGFSISLAAKSHPITTLINAKWSITPVQLEIAEYLSDSSNQKYWLYIDELASLKVGLDGLETEHQRYKAAIGAATTLITQAQLKLLKLSLSLKSLTPRIQSNFMIADEILKRGDCSDSSKAFVIIGGELVCSVSELRQKLKKPNTGSSTNSELYSFDHIFPGSENNELITMLYGEAGNPEFNEFHRILKAEAQKGAIKYITRHFSRHRSATKVRLSGYGVELHLKSTEYKAQDDSPRKDKDEQIDDSVESDVEGFDFAVLKERYPHLSHSLDRLRGSMLEKNEEIAPLKAWEFQELVSVNSISLAQVLNHFIFRVFKLPNESPQFKAKRPSRSFSSQRRISRRKRRLWCTPPSARISRPK